MFETLKKLFTPVQSMDAEKAKEFIAENEEGTYTLLDVRQPKEYERAHIPGAELIPLPQLGDSLEKLDRDKPVIVYCAIGGRSRVAAQMLSGYGFDKIYNLSGGIQAWNGLVAEGPVGLNLELIRGDERPAEIVRLAYGMEASVGHFYRAVKSSTPDAELAGRLDKLATVEDRHKAALAEYLTKLGDPEITADSLEAAAGASVMEGGFSGEELLEKNRAILDSVPHMLDLAMMLETQALDLYRRFAEKSRNEETKKLLYTIAEEEKKHLEALGQLRDERA